MDKLKTPLALVLGTAMLFSACTSQSDVPSPASETPGEAGQSYETTTVPSNSLAQVTASPTSQTTSVVVQKSCVPLVEDTIENSSLYGRLIVSSQDNNRFNYFSLMDFGSEEVIDITPPHERSQYQAFVSPNGQWFAFRTWLADDMQNDRLVVSSLGAGIEYSIPWNPNEWLYIAEWPGDDGLLIKTNELKQPIIYNPFLDSQEGLDIDFPDTYPLGDGWRNHLFISINSDFSRVVYPSTVENTAVLFDLIAESVVEVIPNIYQESTPQWSPSGSSVILASRTNANSNGAGGFGIVLANNDGELEYLEPTDSLGLPSGFSWSPDEGQVAFWGLGSNSESSLYIFDLTAKKIIDTCFASKSFPESEDIPVWSRDGSLLAFQLFEGGEQSDDDGYLVVWDLTNGTAFKFAERLRPVGWIQDE